MHEREELEGHEADLPPEIHRELRQTLRQPMPLPDGLADRIVRAALASHPAQTAVPAPARLRTTGRRRMDWRRAVAAVLLVGVIAGMGSGYVLSRRARAQPARQARVQFALAMEITDNMLRDVRRQVQQQLGEAAAAVPEQSR
jgi:hypothetical protein